MPKNFLFVVFEGIDGSGKTTVSKQVSEALTGIKIPNVWHREPTESVYGKKIRQFLTGRLELKTTEQLELFIEDRKLSVTETIRPNLEKKYSVIQDRYYFSTAAYQGKDPDDAQYILEKNEAEDFPIPDIVYFLDLSPEEALERRKLRGGSEETFDRMSEQTRIYRNYLDILPESAIFIDASSPLDEIIQFCLENIKEKMET
ncbi:dTMP kinase [Leptospira sp. 96542]|nr:dTMP kinase [Leptospira sp. 96542]